MNEQLVRDCLRMFRECENYYIKESEKDKCTEDFWGAIMAYNSAACMLEYALKGDSEALKQFDYYGEEK